MQIAANWTQIDANWTQTGRKLMQTGRKLTQTGRKLDANWMQIEYTIDAICAYEPNSKQKGAGEY